MLSLRQGVFFQDTLSSFLGDPQPKNDQPGFWSAKMLSSLFFLPHYFPPDVSIWFNRKEITFEKESKAEKIPGNLSWVRKGFFCTCRFRGGCEIGPRQLLCPQLPLIPCKVTHTLGCRVCVLLLWISAALGFAGGGWVKTDVFDGVWAFLPAQSGGQECMFSFS